MATRRDYYEVLGVPRDADAKTIKEAFRKLALRYHPDRSQEPDAEERFKEIAEAYAVLGNAGKRADYDARGFAGVAGVRPEDLFGGVDFEDLFGDLGFASSGPGGLFDGLFGRRRRGPRQGADVEIRVEVPLETIVKGGEQRVAVAHPRPCERCSGSGAKPGTQPRSCEVCGGTGQRSSVKQQHNVRLQTVTTCAECRGRGRLVDQPCDGCGGSGEVSDRETLKLRIPVGAEDGRVLRVPGKGRPAPEPGGTSGDLFVTLATRPDSRFERRGPHLWRTEPIEPADAVLGTTLRVPTLGGHARLEVPAGTQPSTVLRLPGMGLPGFGGRAAGDLYVALQVRIPEKLTPAEEKLWERLRALKRHHGG